MRGVKGKQHDVARAEHEKPEHWSEPEVDSFSSQTKAPRASFQEVDEPYDKNSYDAGAESSLKVHARESPGPMDGMIQNFRNEDSGPPPTKKNGGEGNTSRTRPAWED